MDMRMMLHRLGFAAAVWTGSIVAQTPPATYTPLQPLPAPKIIASSPAYPGAYEVGFLLDGDGHTEYASNATGTNTFVEMEFPEAVTLAGFQHVERNDPATIAESELIILDAGTNVVTRIAVKHVNERGGVTFLTFPSISVKRIRWQITKLGSGLNTVGGAGLTFFTLGPIEP